MTSEPSQNKPKKVPESSDDAWAKLEHQREKRQSLEGMASAAAGGDRECAQALIDTAEVEIEDSRDLSPELREYLVHCLSRIRSGESADHAFNLKGAAGRPEGYWSMERDVDIARAVAYHYCPDQGIYLDQALDHVTATYKGFSDCRIPVGRAGVERAYKRFKPKRHGKE